MSFVSVLTSSSIRFRLENLSSCSCVLLILKTQTAVSLGRLLVVTMMILLEAGLGETVKVDSSDLVSAAETSPPIGGF